MGTNRQILLKELLFSPSDKESATPEPRVWTVLRFPGKVALEMVGWENAFWLRWP